MSPHDHEDLPQLEPVGVKVNIGRSAAVLSSREASSAQLLDDPANFLHSIDLDADQATFFRTNTELLREASFIDGRIPIALAESVHMPLSEIIDSARPTTMIDRLVFNCSFCGSTLLARLLDVPGRSLVLKEPRCLTDIAAWRNFNLRDGLPIDRLESSLKLARAALRRPFTPGEAVTVKVGSSGNVLLDTLAQDAAQIRPVFITIGRTSFLRAIFRGGVQRMHYAATIAWHMATNEPDGDALLKEAVRAAPDPLRKAANLAILARFLQVGKFQRAALAGGWDEAHVIDYDDIVRAPEEAVAKAALALDLDLGAGDIERNVERLAGRYSKGLEASFSSERQSSADREILAEHRQVFDDALSWAEKTLGPQRIING